MRARSGDRYRLSPKENVIPAQAGIHSLTTPPAVRWIPACAGMTVKVGTIVIGLAAATSPAAAAEPPPGASSCTGCHAASAAVETPVPRLAGQPAPRIAEAMLAFRSGQR